MELLDFIPVVGTVKNTIECVAAALDGDGGKAFEKGLSAMVGGTLDVATFGAGFAICQMLANEGVTMVVKEGRKVLLRESGKFLAKETVTYVAVGATITNFKIREKIVRPISKSIPLQQSALISAHRHGTPAHSAPVFTQTVNDQPPTSRSASRHRTQAQSTLANARTVGDQSPTSRSSPRHRTPAQSTHANARTVSDQLPTSRSAARHRTQAQSTPANARTVNDQLPTSRSAARHRTQAQSTPANARTVNDQLPTSRSPPRHRPQAQSTPVNEHLHTKAEENQQTDAMQSPHMSYSRLAEIIYFFQRQWYEKEDESKENKQPSRRGEHVINNNVLNVYRDIVQSFVSLVLGDNLDDMIKSGRLSTNSRVIEAINQPIPGPIADFIRYQMVVYYDEEFQDKNAMTYGREIEILRNTVINYMRHVHEEVVYHISAGKHVSRIPALERDVRDTVGMFIAGKYFVDYETLDKWLKQPGNDREQFEEARQTVISMFRSLIYDNGNDMVITWVNELIHAWRKK